MESFLPLPLDRASFIIFLGELIHDNYLCSDYITSGVWVADSFVRELPQTFLQKDYSYPSDPIPILPGYSRELAHVITVLISKVYDDFRYSLPMARREEKNGHLYKLEYTVAVWCRFSLPFLRQMSTIENVLCSPQAICSNAFFCYLAQEVCTFYLFLTDPRLLVVAILLLSKRRNLRVLRKVRQHRFSTLVRMVSRETGAEEKEVLSACREVFRQRT